MPKSYENLKKTSDKNSELQFSAELPLEAIDEHANDVIKSRARDFQMPGFRKGKVPANMVREHFSEADIFESAVDRALRGAIGEIMTDEKITAIGVPQINVTEIELAKPVKFTVRFAVDPEATLPDYKTIGSEILARKNEIKITDEEIENSISEFKKMVAAQRAYSKPNRAENKNSNTRPSDSPDSGPNSPSAQNPTDSRAPSPHANSASESDDSVRTLGSEQALGDDPAANPVELTDETVSQFGNFKTVADFRAELVKQFTFEKEMQMQEAKRDEVVDMIVSKTKITVPPLLVEHEWQHFIETRDRELAKAGMTFEEYLKEMKKTEQEFEKDEKALIEKRIRTSLVFRKIQEKEEIKATDKEIQSNAAYLKRRYPDHDDAWIVRTAEAFIVQDKIFKLFEAKKEEPTEKKEEEKLAAEA